MLKKSLALFLSAMTLATGPVPVLARGLQEPGIPNLDATTPHTPDLSSNDAWANAFEQYLRGLQNINLNQNPATSQPGPLNPHAVINAAPTHNGTRATDVVNHPWENLLLYAYSRGYLNLVGQNSLQPQQTITRGAFAYGLGNFISGNTAMMNGLGASTTRRNVSFSDVASGAFYHGQVIELGRRHIIHQGNNTAFRPEETITREDAARMVFNLIGTLGRFDAHFPEIAISTTLSRFTDSNFIANANRQAVAYLADRGMLTPNMTTGQLNPRGTLTRAEAAALLVNLELYLGGGPQWHNVAPELIRIQARHITPTSFDIEFTVNNAAIQNGVMINHGFSPTQVVVNPGNITNPAILPNSTTTNLHSLRLINTFGHHSVYALTVIAPFPEHYFVYANLSSALGNTNTPVRMTTALATAGQQAVLPWESLELQPWHSIFSAAHWSMGLPTWQGNQPGTAPGSWQQGPNNNPWGNTWQNNQPNNNWNWGQGWHNNNVISFGNIHIENEVRRQLGRGGNNNTPIFAGDVRHITEIHVELPAHARVTSGALDGLQHFTGLRHLTFSYLPSAIGNGQTDSSLSNFNVLQELDQLETLALRGHNISNLQGMRHLRNLRHLDLRDNNITQVGEFGNNATRSSLANLRSVDLRHNRITNFYEFNRFVEDHGYLVFNSNALWDPQRN